MVKAKTGIGIDVKVEFHVLPEQGETMGELLERLAGSEYDVLGVDQANSRVLVGRVG